MLMQNFIFLRVSNILYINKSRPEKRYAFSMVGSKKPTATYTQKIMPSRAYIKTLVIFFILSDKSFV